MKKSGSHREHRERRENRDRVVWNIDVGTVLRVLSWIKKLIKR